MLQQSYFDFFAELAQNNDRDWFLAQKKRYESVAKEPFLALVEQIVVSLNDSEPDLSLIPVKQMLFRINRDARFSKDKRPYKEHLSASIGRFGTKDKLYPGHYLQLSAGESMIAGGAYFFEEKETLLRVRRYISDNAETFAALINDKNFKQKWGKINGKQNKRMPEEFKQALESQPLIANTQFYWAARIDKTLAMRPDFVNILRGYFEAAQPLNEFLRAAIYS
ncbi:MAG: DUF2461 domain-containing protein [Saprospiraceae bacterium]|nr:DUF2461 domain-containing protein [Saprospiraceae bacterium]